MWCLQTVCMVAIEEREHHRGASPVPQHHPSALALQAGAWSRCC